MPAKPKLKLMVASTVQKYLVVSMGVGRVASSPQETLSTWEAGKRWTWRSIVW